MSRDEIKMPELPEDVKKWFAKAGSVGGKKSSGNLTGKQRKARAKKAARARWKNKEKNDGR